MLKAYFVLTFCYAIYCTVQHHGILLYKYGAIEINKHLHLHEEMRNTPTTFGKFNVTLVYPIGLEMPI